jgi:hypothetical protein
MPYTYSRERDGPDETFDIRTPDGELLASVHLWDASEFAEAKAALIVNALNACQPPLLDTIRPSPMITSSLPVPSRSPP